MSETTLEALNALAEKFGLAIDWTSSNVLPYAKDLMNRIIRYEMATSIMWMVVGIIMVLSFFGWARPIRYYTKKEEEDKWGPWDIYKTLVIMACAVIVLTGIIIVVRQTDDIVRCVIIPETIIMNYIQGYM